MDPKRTPVLVAVGQSTEREEIVNAVEMAARASEAALASAPRLRDHIEQVSMVSVVFSQVSARPASELAARLGLAPRRTEYTTPGGNLPQWMVTRAGREVAEGKLDAALIAGGEATRSMRAADPNADFMGAGLASEGAEAEPDPVVGPSMDGVMGPAELSIGLVRPTEIYPMLENARAHGEGRGYAEQRRFLGPLMSRFSQVAADHPFAWFREALSPEQVASVTDSNRLIAEPYTRCMNAFPNVDQGAAVVVTSLETARALGLEDSCLFLWAGATNQECAPATRPDPGQAPAMRAAASATLAAAGIGVDDLSLIDLYSCFPVAVEAGAEALGVALDDARGLTLTGGLPFFGGPGNNYSMHAIATLWERLREAGGLGYIGANGGFLSKHSMGVYGTTPPPNGFVAVDTREAQAKIDASAIEVTTEASGEATVVTSTVVYDRAGGVADVPVIATLDDGRRVAARADESSREAAAREGLIGARVRLEGSPLRFHCER
jgi:acetyl-CoA C-acetyltransferase